MRLTKVCCIGCRGERHIPAADDSKFNADFGALDAGVLVETSRRHGQKEEMTD
jgi:hypothetical protein